MRMEVGTAATPSNTGSTTMADLAALAGTSYGDAPALKYKAGDEWVETSYDELASVARWRAG
jgi:hypothetical protein